MLRCATGFFLFFLIGMMGSAFATTYTTDPATEWEKKQNSDERLQAYGEDILGDGIDPHMGALSFQHTDISLPGNSHLEVALRRTRGQGFNFGLGVDYGFADWDVETPRMEINLPDSQYNSIFAWDGQRCSTAFNAQFIDVVVARQIGEDILTADVATVTFSSHEYSSGLQMKVPGQGSQQVLESYDKPQFPSSASHVTTEGWRIECYTISTGVEGFYAYAPNGDRYRFDVHTSREQKFLGTYQKFDLDLFRDRHFLFASEVTDVNGNWVKYDYDAQGRLTKIHSNDGRQIDLTYHSGTDLIATATANGRTWTYNYRQSTFQYRYWGLIRQTTPNQVLASVTQPDGRSWTFTLDGMNAEPYSGETCVEVPVTVSLTHPYGMTGSFALSEHRHRQSVNWVAPKVNVCYMDEPGPSGGEPPQPVYVLAAAEAMSVTSKTLSGPNFPQAVWTFDYEEDPQPKDVEQNTPATTNWSTMTDPNGNVIKYFHYWNDEDFGGKLFRKEVYDASNLATPVEVTEKTYLLEDIIGGSFASIAPVPTTMRNPGRENTTVIARAGDTFATDNDYDSTFSSSTYSWGFPTLVTHTSSVASGSRTVATTYEHNSTKWVLGLPKVVTRNGKEFDRFTWDTLGRMTEWKQFGIVQREVGYHTASGQAGMIAWVDDALDNRYLLDNYKRGTPQQLTLPDNEVLSRVVDNNGWVTSFTGANGETTGLEYNDVGWRTKLIPPKTNGPATDTIIDYVFATSGRVQQTVTQGDFEKVVLYDALLRPYRDKTRDKSIAGSARYVHTEYDALSNVTFSSFPTSSQTAGGGVNTTFDVLKRPTGTAQNVAPFATTSTEYLSGYQVKTTDPRGNITTTTFDAWGAHAPANPAQDPGEAKPWEVPLAMLVDAPLGADMAMTYDNWGNALTQTQGTAVTTSVYDASLRLYTMTDPDNYTSYSYYDAANRPIVTVDGEGRKTRSVYDVMGRATKVIKAWAGANDGTGATLDCATMRSSYDPANGYLQQCYRLATYTATGQAETLTDANGNVTKYAYDALDRLTHTYFPDKTTAGQWSTTDYEQLTYNGLSQMVSKRTRRADVITYTNDAMGHLIDRHVPGAPTHTANGRTVTHDYTHDDWGNILAATHDGETLSYDYDDVGRVTSQSHNSGTIVSYTWDAANNLTKLTWPDGFDVDYEWDANNRVTAAKDGTRVLASVAYDALSRRSSVSYDNGSSASYTYTDRGDLTDHDLSFAGAAANYDYLYNGVGQLTSRAISDPTFSWLPLASGTDAYAVNGLNQYTTVGGTAVVYDGNGNLTTDHNSRSFTYDAENVLRSATGLASGSATYRYHADGSRREKTAQGATTQFYYMGGLGYLDEEDTQFAADQEIAEYDGATLLRRYIRLPGSIDETFLMIDTTLSGGCTTSSYAACEVWAQADRLGSVVATLDSSGTLLEKYRYSPYGVSGWEGEAGFPFRFTGQKLDPETGLYYYKARYYDPEVGRFLQTDPIGYEDQMNLYAYVANDPVNGWDPTGMATVTSCGNYEGSGSCSEIEGVTGETYDNIDLAANAAADGLGDLTEGDGNEWGVVFEENDDGSVTVSVAVSQGSKTENGKALNAVRDASDNAIGDMHTHPTPQPGTSYASPMSGGDVDRADIAATQNGEPYAVVVLDGPSGRLIRTDGRPGTMQQNADGSWQRKPGAPTANSARVIGRTRPLKYKKP